MAHCLVADSDNDEERTSLFCTGDLQEMVYFFFFLEKSFNLSPVGDFIGSAYRTSAVDGRAGLGFGPVIGSGPVVRRTYSLRRRGERFLSASSRLNGARQAHVCQTQKLDRLDDRARNRAAMWRRSGAHF